MSAQTLVCFLEWTACITGLVVALIRKSIYWYYWLIALFAVPIVNEFFLTLKGRFFKHRVLTSDYVITAKDWCPIVYNARYDPSFFGLERLSPFDPTRSRHVFEGLKQAGVINEESMIMCRPFVPGRELM
jgi:hypothetical protein